MCSLSSPFVSILVPCFNVEKFVEQCLVSLKTQTLKNIEIICLNDGSTDQTLALIRKVADGDARFKIIDKQNSGYGATMNLGLTLARGEYIGIVESDDYVEPTMFEKLYREAQREGLDISRCCFNSVKDGIVKKECCRFLPKNYTFDPHDKIDSFLNPPSIWAAIYKKSLIDTNDIRFLETPGAAFQDTSFAFKTLLVAKRLKCIEEALLNYRIHGGNSVKRPNNIFAVVNELNECISFAKKHHAEDVLNEVILQIEYATFKWNYLRLPYKTRNLFFDAWCKRWKEYNKYANQVKFRNLKVFVYFVFVTKLPVLMRLYLEQKLRR